MKKRKTLITILVALLLTVFLAGHAQLLLVPHDRASNPEAFMLHEYLDIDASEDAVVFVGDCEVYETFVPVVMWQEEGIESRVVGTPQQLLWHSYAVLDEVFRRSDPKVIVLSVYGLVYNEPQSEAYNRMVLDPLPMSDVKREVMQVALTEEESVASYYVPLLRYHDRWSQLTWRDVTTLVGTQENVTSRGYLVKTDVVGAPTSHPSHEGALPPVDTAFGETALEWFDRIVTLCRENEAALVLVKAPTDSWRYPWYDEYEEQVVALAEKYELPYYNLLDAFDEIGLDLTTDSYDGGLHLNVYGAEKVSKYFGGILRKKYKMKDTYNYYSYLHPYWEAEVARYEAMKGEVSEP